MSDLEVIRDLLMNADISFDDATTKEGVIITIGENSEPHSKWYFDKQGALLKIYHRS